MWFSSIYKSEESGLLGASFEPLPEEASIVFPPCGSLLEWWSNAKYQILSTKSQGFRCRVSMLRIQVSGVGCQGRKTRNWNVLERSGNPVWSEAAAGNTETSIRPEHWNLKRTILVPPLDYPPTSIEYSPWKVVIFFHFVTFTSQYLTRSSHTKII